MTLVSCTKEASFDKKMMNIKGVLNNAQTKVSDSGFENSDQIGVFVIDYSGTTPGSLSPTTNHATNVKHTYVASSNDWSPETGKEIYWNDAVTKVDVYGYFPYNSSVTSISAYPFSVQTDQSSSSNYFNSDFLWAKTSNVTAQTLPVTLTFGHRMSKIVITTTAGAGFTASEFNAATKSVQILGTKLSSKINLSDGTVNVDNSSENGTITPKANGNVFTAVLVPQTIAESTVLFKVTVNGVEYYYSKGFTFESNKQYNFTVSVNKNSLSMLSNSVSEWTVDGNVYSVKEEAVKKDIDGNIYTTVKIGTQTWMVENLKTTRYRNGELIGTTTPATLDISAESAPKYQWAYAGNESNVLTYGRLYTWYAATDSRGICPVGWHLPTDSEWTTLYTFLGGGSDVGGKLKETGTTHWLSPNAGATNSSGFSALPGGHRNDVLTFSTLGDSGTWWSSTEYNTDYPWNRGMNCNFSNLYRDNRFNKNSGLSVRCIRDF
jgi:uncharacterized protein (TIGR02145 family)